jgi:hypothetical protein
MEDYDQEWLSYQHSSGIVSLEYPEQWQVEEPQVAQQFQTVLRSDDGKVFFRLTIQPATEEHSVSVLEQLSEQFLEQNHSERVGYRLESLDRQPDESVWASYVYGEKPDVVVGDLLYWVDDQYLLRLEVEQAENSVDSTQAIVDDIIDTLELEPDIPFSS